MPEHLSEVAMFSRRVVAGVGHFLLSERTATTGCMGSATPTDGCITSGWAANNNINGTQYNNEPPRAPAWWRFLQSLSDERRQTTSARTGTPLLTLQTEWIVSLLAADILLVKEVTFELLDGIDGAQKEDLNDREQMNPPHAHLNRIDQTYLEHNQGSIRFSDHYVMIILLCSSFRRSFACAPPIDFRFGSGVHV